MAVPDAAYFGLSCVYCPLQLVDMASGLGEALVSDRASALDRRDEAMSDGSGRVGERVVLHAEEGRS